MIKHSFKNISQEEKILMYVNMIKSIKMKEVEINENRSNLCKTERRKKRQFKH